MNNNCGACMYISTDLNQIPCQTCRIQTTGRQVLHRHWESKDIDRPTKMDGNQTAKADAGKLKLTLVPQQIIKDIAKIREYGNQKYGDPDNWRTVDKDRYKNAAYRHWLAYLDDPQGVDEESGLPHLAHLATNIAFLCEMEK